MNEKDIKHLKLCIEKELPKSTKGQVIYWRDDKTNCFEFRRVISNNRGELNDTYVFEFDVYTKIKVAFDDIEHILLTGINTHNDPSDKYDLKGFYD